MEEYGLILCGGGGRGAYQVGVMRALERLSLRKRITAVSGTSVGALNAALFSSLSTNRAADIWASLKNSDIADKTEAVGRAVETVLGFAFGESRPAAEQSLWGFFSRDGMVRLINENGVCRGICSAEQPVFCCCHNADRNAPEYFDLRAYSPKTITRMLLASSAIPAAFPPVSIGGSTYRDGGLSDNIPVKPLYDLGYRNFIISYLDGIHIDKSRFPNAHFIELFPSEGIYLNEKKRSMLSDGTLDFDGKNAQKRIDLGEQETLAFFMLMGKKLLL